MAALPATHRSADGLICRGDLPICRRIGHILTQANWQIVVDPKRLDVGVVVAVLYWFAVKRRRKIGACSRHFSRPQARPEKHCAPASRTKAALGPPARRL